MLTLNNAIEQARNLGATKYGILYINDNKKEQCLEYSFIHFFNDDNLEVGYFTFSLRCFTNKINTIKNGRGWSKELLKSINDWTYI
jgi:hypothetical protein